ncbi:potassium channel family protein [Jannaschia sp. R86511]|uniref:potassium channel family protein n=1 Tax=Jannaschia sp. R86511 TaxID=3093853 RepID=UPI0036D220E0
MTTPASRGPGRWRRATRTPLDVLAVLFATTFVTQVATGQDDVGVVAGWVRLVVWLAFAVDYLVRVRLSGVPVRFVLTHPVDLLVVAVPLLRPLLGLVARLLRGRGLHGRTGVVARTLVYLVSVTATLVLFVAAAVLVAEQDAPGATIRSLPDALWWTVVTVTTVGYGDLYPVTAIGRLVAVLGMLLGIAVLGTVTATISAQVVAAARQDVTRADAAGTRRDGGADEGPGEEDEITLVDLPQVLAEIRALRREVAALRAAGPAPPDGPGPASR